MFIPLSTDRPSRRRPVVNEILIAINLLVYLAAVAGHTFGWWPVNAIADRGQFRPFDIEVWQLITYQFIHDPFGLGHIIFNLIFLWVFGNAVEARLGRIGYLGFYLVGGAVAGIAHGGISDAPIIGASGSIAAVSGAFLALFPRAHIRVLVVFFIIGVYQIPAAWFILFFFVIDLLNQTSNFLGAGGSRVAYAAHLAGYVYGFLVAVALLALRILPREDYDVFYLFMQMRRRRAFRATVERSQAAVWDTPRADTPQQIGKRRAAESMNLQERLHAEQRAEIARLLADHDGPKAAAKYRTLLALDRNAVMPEGRQIDLANQFFLEEDFRHAKQAYELFLEKYPQSRSADHVRLILALIYTRRAPNPDRATELLQGLPARLLTEADRALANELVAELREP